MPYLIARRILLPLITGFLIYCQACGQDPGRPLPVYRWYISANPLGIAEEPAMAFGLGIGYRLNKRVELFAETSWLASDQYYFVSPLSGFRQIFKARYFPNGNSPARGKSASSRSAFFLGLDLRYKQYNYGDTNDFGNPATHDTLSGAHFQSRHHFFAAGVELGYRGALSRNGRFQFELTIGAGLKFKAIDRVGPPAGYEYLGRYLKTDFDIRDGIEQDGVLPYFPGAVRFLVCFGKIKRWPG